MKLFQRYLKTAFRWQKGRQEGGYDKMLLLHGLYPLPFDLYVIRYVEGSFIKPHIDKVEKGKHFRLNIVLKNAILGGNFICSSTIFNSKKIKLFRPDIALHSVTKVEKGKRYILSLGWIKY